MKNNYSRLKWVALIIIGGILFFLASAANAATTAPLPLQQQEISGVVQDQNGIPIPGVTVTVKNTNRGTITNLDGEYNITAPANGILVFSYIGYKTVEILVDNNEEISIQLEEDVSALGEVKINAGYYNTTRRESTGNISRVTAEEIENQPVVSPIQALQGRMAGVEIISGGANPGGAPTIRIRGTNSLRSEGNYPLYIIDGVPVSSVPVESNSVLSNSGIDPLNNLNPANIESVEVLKDADATAIYGSRGANGVVLITTKNGSNRGLEARIYTGSSSIAEKLDLLNTPQYLQVRREAFQNDGVEPDNFNAYDLVLWDQERYTDWQDLFFGGQAEVTNASLAISGGEGNTTYRIGGSVFSQGTIYPGDYDYRKGTSNLALNHLSKDNLFEVKLHVNYGIDQNNLTGTNGLNPANILLPPNAPSVFNDDGSLNWEDWSEAGLSNPMEGYFNTTSTQTRNLNANLVLSYEIVSGLRLKSSFGYANFTSDELWKLPIRSYAPASNPVNRSSHLSTNRKSWIIEPQLTYDQNFGKLETHFLIGGTLQKNGSDRSSFQGQGYASESLIGDLGSAESIINASSGQAEYKYVALFSRIGLNWDQKYFLNLTGRRDGSSRFGTNNRFASFGAIGAAWILSEESFFGKVDSFLSFAKLRGSYGSTGNDQIGDYGYLDAYQATVGPGGLYPVALANPDYSWEVNKKLELATELGFLKDKLNIGVSWYRNRSSNQLVGYSLPYIAGFNSVQANLPATVQNKGLEIELATINFSNDRFSWRTNLNLSFPENKLLRYPDIDQSSYSNTYRVGEPLNIALLYDYTGLDPETGLYTVRDVNDDGNLSFEDQIITKNLNREFFGGLSNSLRYGNFNLEFLLQYVKQEGRLSEFQAGTNSNVLDVALGNEDFQRYSASYEASIAFIDAVNSDFSFTDASFLRLKTLSMGYNLPMRWTKRLHADQIRLFIHGQNLLTWTPYEGLDPELPTSAISMGNLRSVTAGLQLNF